ncbi:hypothetical protein SESBI_21525 [Sesbania bispinosa]|nr:hypothetical protein SESBI_21525 [Sesbania bispinosa]
MEVGYYLIIFPEPRGQSTWMLDRISIARSFGAPNPLRPWAWKMDLGTASADQGKNVSTLTYLE